MEKYVQMRNTLQYPVTFQEKLDVLELCQSLLRDHVGNSIVGIQEYALQLVIEDLKKVNSKTFGPT